MFFRCYNFQHKSYNMENNCYGIGQKANDETQFFFQK